MLLLLLITRTPYTYRRYRSRNKLATGSWQKIKRQTNRLASKNAADQWINRASAAVEEDLTPWEKLALDQVVAAASEK